MHQLQHSLHMLRSHWGGLKPALRTLHAAVAEHQAANPASHAAHSPPKGQAGGAGGAGGGLQVWWPGGEDGGRLGRLMREWDPSSKGAFDEAAEGAVGEAGALLEDAVAVVQVRMGNVLSLCGS